jgi:hypothetical protein
MTTGERSIGLMALIVVVAATLSWAQTSTSSLRGTIADPKGAVVAGADLTLANPATGFSRTTKTNEEGFYQFLEVPPAAYTLTIKAPGFGTLEVDNVRLLVNTPATLNQTLPSPLSPMALLATSVKASSCCTLIATPAGGSSVLILPPTWSGRCDSSRPKTAAPLSFPCSGNAAHQAM